MKFWRVQWLLLAFCANWLKGGAFEDFSHDLTAAGPPRIYVTAYNTCTYFEHQDYVQGVLHFAGNKSFKKKWWQ